MSFQLDDTWYSNLAMELVAGRVTPFLGAGVNLVGVDLESAFQPGHRLPTAPGSPDTWRPSGASRRTSPPELIKVAQSLSSSQAGQRPSLRRAAQRLRPRLPTHRRP